MTRQRLAEVVVDLEAVRRNFQTVAAHTGCKVLCVIKADAYGHGAREVARVVAQEDRCAGLVTARVDEAFEVAEPRAERPEDAPPVLCLGSYLSAREHRERVDLLRDFGRWGIEPVVSSFEEVRALIDSAAASPPKIHLAFDTGMQREGLRAEEIHQAIGALEAAGIETGSVMSHLLDSEVPDGHAAGQRAAFESALGSNDLPRHLANSAAALGGGTARDTRSEFSRDWAVRVGGALFGLDLRITPTEPTVSPAMRVTSTVVQVRSVSRGSTVGYGARWTAKRDSVVGLVALGYGDGLVGSPPRLLWQSSEGASAVPVVGAVSMDLTTVDLTDAVAATRQAPRVGDRVLILGAAPEHGHTIEAREHAESIGMPAYTVTVGFSRRLPRRFLPAERPQAIEQGLRP